MAKKESSAANLRSQFKATSIKALKNKIDKDDATMGVQNNEYLNLEDGKLLKIRIFPAHPHEENFYVSKMCYWLPFTNDDGEEIGHVLGNMVEDLARRQIDYYISVCQ